jgi:vitamin B12 transporter
MFAVRPFATRAMLAAIAALGLAFSSNDAGAEEATPGTPTVVDPLGEDLPDVALASRRMEIPTQATTGNVITIGQQEIERKGWRTLADVLEHSPALSIVQAGGIGQRTSTFLRGTEASHFLILLDGIELNDPALQDRFTRGDSAYDSPAGETIPHILTENIERIEIVMGQTSALYGPGAVGGVIHIVTKRGRGPAKITGFTEGGANGTYQGALAVHGQTEQFDYSLAYSRLTSDGVSQLESAFGGHERDGYDNDTWSGRFDVQATQNLELSFVGRRTQSRWDVDQFNGLGAGSGSFGFSSGPFSFSKTLTAERFLDDPNNRASSRQNYGRAQAKLDLLNGDWQQRVGVSYTNHDRKEMDDGLLVGLSKECDDPVLCRLPANANSTTTTDLQRYGAKSRTSDGTRIKFDWIHDFFLGENHIVTVGLETERERVSKTCAGLIAGSLDVNYVSLLGSDSRSDSEFDEFVSSTLADASCGTKTTGRTRTNSVYLQEQFKFGENLYGVVGARVDDHNKVGSELTYRARAAYEIPATGTKLLFGIGSAWAPPPAEALFKTNMSGSAIDVAVTWDGESRSVPRFESFVVPAALSLEPERHHGFELGFEQAVADGAARFGSTFFTSRTRNLIVRVGSLDGSNPFANVAKTKMSGFDTFFRVKLGDIATLRASHTYLSAENRTFGHSDLLYRPKQTARASLELAPLEGSTLSLSVRHVGRRKAMVDSGAGSCSTEFLVACTGLETADTLGSYTVLNLGGTYALPNGIKLVSRIDNLLDRKYDDPRHFNSGQLAGYIGIKGTFGE